MVSAVSGRGGFLNSRHPDSQCLERLKSSAAPGLAKSDPSPRPPEFAPLLKHAHGQLLVYSQAFNDCCSSDLKFRKRNRRPGLGTSSKACMLPSAAGPLDPGSMDYIDSGSENPAQTARAKLEYA